MSHEMGILLSSFYLCEYLSQTQRLEADTSEGWDFRRESDYNDLFITAI